MKKLLLATLVTAASVGVAHADGPTVYGKINVSVDDTKSGLQEGRVTTVDSNASRFGIKGSEKLTDALSAVYQIEWGVAIDNNSNSATQKVNNNTDTYGGSTYDLNARNRWAGLQYDGVGTLKAGRFDTNLKTSQYVNPAAGVDIFDDYVNGSFDMTNTLTGENRVNNTVGFESAKFDTGYGVVSGNFQVILKEAAINKATPCTSLGNCTGSTGTSTSLLYQNKDVGLYGAVAYDSNVANTWNAYSSFSALPKTAPTIAYSNDLRLVGSVDLGTLVGADGLIFNGLFQNSKATNLVNAASTPEETAYLISAIYNFPASILKGLAVKAQWQNATTKDITTTSSDVKIQQVGVDVDYAFSAKTKVYTFWTQRTYKNPNNPSTIASGMDTNFKYSGFGVGLEQKF